jgi:hypothetical protein
MNTMDTMDAAIHEENMGPDGWGAVYEVPATDYTLRTEYADGTTRDTVEVIPRHEPRRMAAAANYRAEMVDNLAWDIYDAGLGPKPKGTYVASKRAAVIRFQEFAPGGPGRAQYVQHPLRGRRDAKKVADHGPGNLNDNPNRTGSIYHPVSA